MSAYYNEIDPFAAAWLRELIKAGHLPAGDVDERSIEDVTPNELRGYTQCHFFAGIGGWAYALDLAGWPRDRPVWTGSCPCQPFSAAGKGAGFADERHLWPAWQHLIAQCAPPVVLGEQVASKHADAWIDLVHADLEGMGYAFGCIPFPSAGVGAPQNRERAYWVADADDAERRAEESTGDVDHGTQARRHEGHSDAWQRLHAADWLAYAASVCTDAHGLSARVGRLRGYGNAINPAQAAAFIRATEAAVADQWTTRKQAAA